MTQTQNSNFEVIYKQAIAKDLVQKEATGTIDKLALTAATELSQKITDILTLPHMRDIVLNSNGYAHHELAGLIENEKRQYVLTLGADKDNSEPYLFMHFYDLSAANYGANGFYVVSNDFKCPNHISNHRVHAITPQTMLPWLTLDVCKIVHDDEEGGHYLERLPDRPKMSAQILEKMVSDMLSKYVQSK